MKYLKSEEEVVKEEKVNVDFVRRKSKAKSFLGLLQGDLISCRKRGNLEMAKYIEERIGDYNKFHTKAMVELISWKGKSGILVIQRPDSFDVIRYRKKDKNSTEAKEIIKNYTKEQVNLVINSINAISEAKESKNSIKTREIASKYCKLSGLTENTHNRPLFDLNGFIWDNFFSCRVSHTELTDILGILDYYKVIEYVGGFSTILKKTMNVQELLNQ